MYECAGSLLEDIRVLVGLVVMLVWTAVACWFYQDNQRLQAEITRLERDNQHWHLAFREQGSELSSKQAALRAQIAANHTERRTLQDTEEALVSAETRLSSILVLADNAMSGASSEERSKSLVSNKQMLDIWSAELNQVEQAASPSREDGVRVEHLRGLAARARGNLTDAIGSFETVRRQFEAPERADHGTSTHDTLLTQVLFDLGQTQAACGETAGAIATLRQAVALRAGAQVLDPIQLASDSELAAVRDLPAFRLWMDELADRNFPADPFATEDVGSEPARDIARR